MGEPPWAVKMPLTCHPCNICAYPCLDGNSYVKANVKLRSDNGDVFTDFEVKLGGMGGRTQIDKSIVGTINGGGPEIRFTTLNGRITLHKAK